MMAEQDYQNMLPIGTLLQDGKYRVVGYLGSGGFGNTYEVEHVTLHRHWAVKEFFMQQVNRREGTTVTTNTEADRATFEMMREKFLKEAQRMACMIDPHIVEVTDFFEDNETAYYVMKLIDGKSLAAMMKDLGRAFSEEEVLVIVPQVLAALKTAHSQNVYHLDLKPANIMCNEDGYCWLIDFGASKQMTVTDNRTKQISSLLCSTPGFAPAEQKSQNKKHIGPWTDFYALGATIYFLLTGELPPDAYDIEYDGEEAFSFPAFVSEPMRQLILWLMQHNYRQRPQTIEEIEQRLSAFAAPAAPAPQVNTPVAPNVSVDTVLHRPDAAGQALDKEKEGDAKKKAQEELEATYRKGCQLYDAGKYKEAYPLLLKTAEQGYVNAQNDLGEMYFHGLGVEKNDSDAMTWYRKAAEQGSAHAQNKLGEMYHEGWSFSDATKWYRKAAAQGYARAQYNLGWMYFHGYGVDQSDLDAVKWYRKAAEQGYAVAQFYLGEIYEKGRGVEQSDSEALKWYRKAADRGYVRARKKIPELERKLQEEEEAKRKAEEEAKKKAQEELEATFRKGCQLYDAGKYKEAFPLLLKAAEQGNAKVQFRLGLMFRQGWGIDKSDSDAVKWYRKAADQGHADAQCNLGFMYERGLGVEKSYSDAVKWYRKAVDQGHARAQCNLGLMYERGFGVDKSFSDAVKWYRKAADQGHAIAQCNLGFMYENGFGVDKNYSDAVKWYQKAAEQEYARALCNLGIMYEKGRGVEKSDREALRWYKKAAEQGDTRAQKKVDELYEKHKLWKLYKTLGLE